MTPWRSGARAGACLSLRGWMATRTRAEPAYHAASDDNKRAANANASASPQTQQLDVELGAALAPAVIDGGTARAVVERQLEIDVAALPRRDRLDGEAGAVALSRMQQIEVDGATVLAELKQLEGAGGEGAVLEHAAAHR